MLCFEKDFLSKNKSVSFVLLPDFFSGRSAYFIVECLIFMRFLAFHGNTKIRLVFQCHPIYVGFLCGIREADTAPGCRVVVCDCGSQLPKQPAIVSFS